MTGNARATLRTSSTTLAGAVAGEIRQHGEVELAAVGAAHLAVWVAATAGLLTGVLALHFTRLLPWWRP